MLFAIEGNASGSREGFFARGWAAACVACARQELAGAWRQRERMPGMGTRAAAPPRRGGGGVEDGCPRGEREGKGEEKGGYRGEQFLAAEELTLKSEK